MFLVTQERLESYLKNDITADRLNKISHEADEQLTCQKWLRDSDAKRYIFEYIYGPLFQDSHQLKVVDVGGGITGLTRELAKKHNYVLVDLLAHDSHEYSEQLMDEVGKRFIIESDWMNIDPVEADVIIANDVFPNVDQRLDLFLSRFLPRTKKIILSLTYYNEPRHYMTRRIEGDEILCFLAWNGVFLRQVLEKYSKHIKSYDNSVFENDNKSVYNNGRQVCLIELKGYLG